MIELIYNEEGASGEEEKQLPEPKNVKQVGEPREYKKIFIEDYVHTFLMQYSADSERKMKIAVLLGFRERSGGVRHFYIQSALPVDTVTEKKGVYAFSEKLWGEIYRKCEEAFPGQEIMGWFLSRPGFPVEKTAVMEETHRTYFSGADKVLFVLEPLEGESAFFGFDGNRFAKQPGYYIYYEKNEPMRNFMLEENERKEEPRRKEQPDIAMANFRKILQEKQRESEKRKKIIVSYGAKASVLFLLLAGIVALKQQSDQIQVMEPKAVSEGTKDEVVVEEVSGEIKEQEAKLPVTEMPTEEPQEEALPEPEPPVPEEVPEEAGEEAEEEALKEPEQETSAEPTYEEYRIEAGDTLAGISRSIYGNDGMVEEICELNGIEDGDYIQVGEIILLP